MVAPLRGRGLKLRKGEPDANGGRRSLTGAWIETGIGHTGNWSTRRRSLTGAWIETTTGARSWGATAGRSLTGAWIETFYTRRIAGYTHVAPLRGRGLKRLLGKIVNKNS